jgi:hypothetical protein
VAAAAGLDFVHVSAGEQRFDFPEIMGGGAALFDVDLDGDLDLYLVQSGDLRAPDAGRWTSRLYENDGRGHFRDATAERGGASAGYGMGCAVGDYDGDGDGDLYVTNVGANVLYQNDAGRLVDVTAGAGVGDASWSTSAAFADCDGDGWLDLYVANYVRWSPETERNCSFPKEFRDYCSPKSYAAPARDVLYRNRGDGTFEDVTEAAGLGQALGNGLGVVSGDLDGDGALDLYVANDLDPNYLWLGDGRGHFREAALLAGCALSGTGFAESGMGVQAVDFEGDGDLDLFVTNLRRQTNTAYTNQAGAFDDSTARLGLSAASLPFTGFGLGFHDFDCDGWLDLYVANGDVTVGEELPDARDPYAQEDLLFAGGPAPGGQGVLFREVLPRGGTAVPLLATGRGAAFGDVDGDGDVDAVVVNRDGPPHLLENQVGSERSWVLFDVRDRAGRASIGARVELSAGGRTQWRLVDTAYSYCSASDVRVHFGLGELLEVEQVAVHWPDGSTEAYGPLEARALHVLRQTRAR